MRAILSGLCLSLLLPLGGCRGTVPRLHGSPEQGIAAVVVGARLLAPSGETKSGRLWVNLEAQGGREAEAYRLPIAPRGATLFQVEPGTYHLAPARNIFGVHHKTLTVRIDGRSYTMPFPRDFLRKSGLRVKPTKIVSLGVFEAKLSKALPGRKPELRVRLDDSIAARRGLVQDLIRDMMDPDVPSAQRLSAIAWTRALDQTLLEILSETEGAQRFKSGQSTP